LSGGTGRATAPHLHVGVRWQGIYIDPATLLSMPLPWTDCGLRIADCGFFELRTASGDVKPILRMRPRMC